MTAPKSSKPASSKPKTAPEKATYKNIYRAPITVFAGTKLGVNETIELTEKEAEVCGEMLARV